MKQYNSMSTEALELVNTLPEEQNELYKKHFVPIPLDRFIKEIKTGENPHEVEELRELSNVLDKKLGVKSDILIGSTVTVSQNRTKHVKVINLKDVTEDHLLGKMHNSNEDRLVAFMHAYSRHFVFIEVPEGETAHVNLLFANIDAPLTAQVLINVGRGATLDLFEWNASKTKSQSLLGVMHEIRLESHSKADVNIVHNEDNNTWLLNHTKGKLNDNSVLNANYVYNGGCNSRAKNEFDAFGYSANSRIIEMIMGSREQKFDINTVITNTGEGTVSDLESKASGSNNSGSILKGFANVGDNARNSKSFVNERGLLLDKSAYIISIPGMSINNANVKATHSSATAPVDEDSMFYMMSRGTDAITAKRLLVAGFFAGSIAKISNPLVREVASSLMCEKINTGTFGNIPKLDTSALWIGHSYGGDMFEGHYKYRDRKMVIE
ncbi:MAG: SufD family Fe-S cluster assembly protein [Candidatus Marsarchaeota archaeon]|nr:SufD family Fe-S cluster assembly protein [Candidatus Marsarchaeota archaeon]